MLGKKLENMGSHFMAQNNFGG